MCFDSQTSLWDSVSSVADGLYSTGDALGWHIVVVDSVLVRADATWSAVEVSALQCNQTVNILAVRYRADEAIEWGLADNPPGWIPLFNLRTGVRWTKPTSRSKASLGSAEASVRTKTFGPPDEPVAEDDDLLRAAALGDLERLFSGLMPSRYLGPDIEGKDNDKFSLLSAGHQRCFACCTSCCSCRRPVVGEYFV